VIAQLVGQQDRHRTDTRVSCLGDVIGSKRREHGIAVRVCGVFRDRDLERHGADIARLCLPLKAFPGNDLF
jgi:hypothetical protein